MMSVELNDRLTQVGQGTPMGALQRQYWHPITTESSLSRTPVQRVRLLGEDLAVFRDLSGRLGLVPERCPHRGALLSYGFPDTDGVRCPYHGWLYSAGGQCLEQPNQSQDSPRFRDECGIIAYKAAAMGGMIFGYLGPDPAPELPPWDLYTREQSPTSFRDIGWAVIPCNWLQIMENNMDPTHVEWLHGRLFDYHLQRAGAEPSPVFGVHHTKLGFDHFEHGLIKRRLREGQSEEDDDWKVGHPVVFPNLVKVGSHWMASFQVRAPIDDEHTLHFWYTWYEVPAGHEDVVEAVLELEEDYPVRLFNEDGSFSMEHVDSQDAMVWLGQGTRAQRQGEHLCQGDRGVVMFRKQIEDQLEVFESGKDAMNVFRAPIRGPLALPVEHKEDGIGGGAGNPLGSFLRTQGLYSKRLNLAIRLLDGRLGIERQ